MKDNHYAKTIAVKADPYTVYEALTTGYKQWWTETGGKTFETVGDQIQFTFPPLVSYWTFEAERLDVSRTVELSCVDAYHDMVDIPSAPTDEWLGSRLIFDIEPHNDQTLIHFVHQGLTPQLTCYDICERGWQSFFVESLAAYLNTGVGKPFTNSLPINNVAIDS